MKTIPLTKGQFALVDDADYERLSKFKWRAQWRSTPGVFIPTRHGGSRRNPNAKAGWSSLAVSMHHDIMGRWPGMEVDHRDRNPLNNQRENLRWCTPSQNCANRRRRKNKTGFQGVTRLRYGHFMARIGFGGPRRVVGIFPTAIEAARARDAAALKLHGEFATLNFPTSKEN